MSTNNSVSYERLISTVSKNNFWSCRMETSAQKRQFTSKNQNTLNNYQQFQIQVNTVYPEREDERENYQGNTDTTIDFLDYLDEETLLRLAREFGLDQNLELPQLENIDEIFEDNIELLAQISQTCVLADETIKRNS